MTKKAEFYNGEADGTTRTGSTARGKGITTGPVADDLPHGMYGGDKYDGSHCTDGAFCTDDLVEAEQCDRAKASIFGL